MSSPTASPTMNVAPLVHRTFLILASGAVLVSFSEFWFHEIEDDVGHFGILLAYGLLGYLFLMSVEYFRAYPCDPRVRARFV